MATAKFKFLDVDILSFLEEKMKGHTRHYQSDFEIDKKIFRKCAASQRKEDKTLLWMGRTMGTHCVKEHDAFIRDTEAHTTWCHYDNQSSETIIAFAAEITGTVDGVIRGNVYELDYLAHVEQVSKSAVEPAVEEKTFQDGFVERVTVERSSYGYFYDLVGKHGAIVDSITHPKDELQHASVIAQQKQARARLKGAPSKKLPLAQQIQSASSRTAKVDSKPNVRMQDIRQERG